MNEWLKSIGAVSSRKLEVKPDYERGYILVDGGVGKQIDKGLDILYGNDEKGNREKYNLIAKLIDEKLKKNGRRYLLEAVKAKAAVPLIKKYLKAGKQVVVFHDFKKNEATNPFMLISDDFAELDPSDQAKAHKQYEDFCAENTELLKLDMKDLMSPIERFQSELGKTVGIFNGDVKKSLRQDSVDKFNDDEDDLRVLLCQRASAKEGISLHDRTGKHQRVLIDLGLATRPTDLIQCEGRIYRTGVVTNAIIRYLNTGMNFEKRAFADTIAGRSSTAENLSMGYDARNLRDAIVNGFMESIDGDTWKRYLPNSKTEGTGGKARDGKAMSGVSQFDEAVSDYFTNAKKNSRNKSSEGVDYYPTPEPVGFKMVEWLGLKDGNKALEPSAGHGAISRYFSATTRNTIIEPSEQLATLAKMRLKGGTTSRVETTTFEQFAKANKFDGIAMNPPYGKGGKTAMEHLAKAFEHLYDGGRVIAIVPDGPAFNKRFDEWYGSNEAKHAIVMKTIRLPQCTFKRAGTSVATKILVIDKYLTDEDMKQAQGGNEVDLRGIENIKDLFSRIKNMTMPERIGADIKNHFTNTVNKKSINSSYMALVDDVKLMNDDRLYALALDYRGARNVKFGGYGFATESLRNKFERTANKYLAEKANNPNAKVPTTESKPAENTESEQHFTLGTHEDTRPNVDKLYSTARPTKYLGDKYRSISNLAKEHNGHYSKYANNSFIFENENDRNEFVKEADALLAESKLSAKGRADDILNNIQPIATAELTNQERALVALGEKMGVPVKFFTGVSRLNGFHSNGMTFINRNGFKSINWTFWHETLHWLKNNNKALYDEIIREIKAKQAFTKEQLDAYRKSIGRNMSDDETIEEMVADKMPDVYSRVKLFKDLANENPTLCQRLLAWVRHTLDKLKEIISADKKKAGLHAKQVDAMIEAFTRLAGDLRSSDGKKLVEKINKGKDIRIVDSKDNVLYPIDNLKNKTYNAGESLTDAQKTTLFNSIQTRIDDHIANEKQSGKSIDDICAELTSDHSAHREGIINRYKTQYKLFLAHRTDSDFKREQIDRIYPAKKIEDKDVDGLYNKMVYDLKEATDYAGIIYREIALDRRGNNGRDNRVHDWRTAERQRAERERQQNNDRDFSISRSDKDGFSNVRYSLSESEKAGTVESFTKAAQNLLKIKTESNVTDKYSEKQEKKKETPDGKLPKSFIVQSMHHLAKSSESIKRIYNLATKAMDEQEKLRNGFKKSIDKVYRLTKDSKDHEALNQIYSSIISSYQVFMIKYPMVR